MIDVVIPIDPKDFRVLLLTIESVRSNLSHTIDNIFVISLDNDLIKIFCAQHGCIHINEDTILPIKLNDIDYKVKGKNRAGWIFQQLIKLSTDCISDKKYIFVIDADTILVRPQSFISENKMVLLTADEFHKPYFRTFKRIFGYHTVSPVSFIAHQMFFSAKHLSKLKMEIEKTNNKPWYQAIIDNLDTNENSSFSEYETYGNWMMKKYPKLIKTEYFFNVRLMEIHTYSLDHFTRMYGRSYSSISIHKYPS